MNESCKHLASVKKGFFSEKNLKLEKLSFKISKKDFKERFKSKYAFLLSSN